MPDQTYVQQLQAMSPIELVREYHEQWLRACLERIRDGDAENLARTCANIITHTNANAVLDSIATWREGGEYEWLLEQHPEVSRMTTVDAMLLFYRTKVESTEERIENGEYTRLYEVLEVADFLKEYNYAIIVLESISDESELAPMRHWLWRNLGETDPE